jgi:hypothetical protein
VIQSKWRRLRGSHSSGSRETNGRSRFWAIAPVIAGVTARFGQGVKLSFRFLRVPEIPADQDKHKASVN